MRENFPRLHSAVSYARPTASSLFQATDN